MCVALIFHPARVVTGRRILMPDLERVLHSMHLELVKDDPTELAREQGYWKGLCRGRIELLVFATLTVVGFSLYFLYK